MPNWPFPLKVLFFDVFGTCVAQRPTLADTLHEAAQEALKSNTLINADIRIKAEKMSYNDWFEFGGEWNQAEDDFVDESKMKHGAVDWKEVDRRRIESLPKLLAKHGLVVAGEDITSALKVGEGSLWNEAQLQQLGTIWHRLVPWPDTCTGLKLLNKEFSTVALSNTYNELLKSLVAHSNIPFAETYSSDMFQSFKPNSKVYLGAAEKMGVKPEECGLVAAHLEDLKGAKACGFYAIYVERPVEEKNPELKDEGIPDMVINEDENGFVTLAERLIYDVYGEA